MSLRSNLSSNLRRLCETADSIAAVCRATTINRQQFNRYLAGSSIPNRRTRDRICSFFAIDERELFREPGAGEVVAPAAAEGLPLWARKETRAALDLVLGEAPPAISSGIYFAHFVIPQERDAIMRSTVVIRRDGNLTTFRRLTGISERKGSWWSQFVGDHRGIVLERRHVFYFVGLNGQDAREPTLLVLRWQPISRPLLGGHAMILTPSGPTITAVVLNPCRAGMTLRTALRQSHVYSTDDPAIDPIVADVLDQQRQALLALTRHLDLSVRPLPRPGAA